MGAKTKEIVEALSAIDEEIRLADGFEDALIGYVERASQPAVALYDREKCIKVLMKRDKMDRESAVEFFDFNVVGAFVGEHTPAFATVLR